MTHEPTPAEAFTAHQLLAIAGPARALEALRMACVAESKAALARGWDMSEPAVASPAWLATELGYLVECIDPKGGIRT